MKRLSLIAATASLVACSSEPLELAPGGHHDQGIFYGSASTISAVVALTWGGEDNFCTGTLITPTVVLTAAHCIEDIPSDHMGYIDVFFGNTVGGSGNIRSVERGWAHPDYAEYETPDIGLLELVSAAPASATPIPYLPAELGLGDADEGETVLFAGFGATEDDGYGYKLEVEGTIEVVCDSGQGCWLDDGWIAPMAFGYDQDGGGPCSGDSGGPAFIERSGTTYVAGITSYGDEECLYYGASTTVDRQAEAIQAFIDGADLPDGGGCDDASCLPGAGCTSDGQCGGDGACITEGDYPEFDGGYCVSWCGESDCPGDGVCLDEWCYDGCTGDAQCRAGYECIMSPGGKICEPGDRSDPGDSPPGGACSDDEDCDHDGLCWTSADGFPGGYCMPWCMSNADCPSGSRCADDTCWETCDEIDDCRNGYTCLDWGTTGLCIPACDSSADCDGDECNEYGLCGNDEPPAGGGGGSQDDDDDGVASRTRSGSSDEGGCAATSRGGLAWLLVGLALLRRRSGRIGGTPVS